MEQDPEYRQAVIDEGYNPDDPRIRRAIAAVVALLRGVAGAERATHPVASPVTAEPGRLVEHPIPATTLGLSPAAAP
ncbi:hypothetical protein, partial [Rhodococcus sp. EPR-157]|uniref:hypothetical protein n=1 Tax=Rhodococcus sp. EPR-157 TaxID=1813677 RepID=UPI0012E8039A